MLYIRHFHSAWLGMPELLKLIGPYAEDNGLNIRSKVHIEPKASGKSIFQLLKIEKHLNPVEIKSSLVQEGKEARAQTAAPKAESGRVTLVKGGWNDSFIGQLEAYPNGLHDEAIDLIGYAVDNYFKKKVSTGVRKMN